MISKKIARTATSEAKFRELLRRLQDYEKAQDDLRGNPDDSALRAKEARVVGLLEAGAISWLDDVLK
jgi:hypothetical protein